MALVLSLGSALATLRAGCRDCHRRTRTAGGFDPLNLGIDGESMGNLWGITVIYRESLWDLICFGVVMFYQSEFDHDLRMLKESSPNGNFFCKAS